MSTELSTSQTPPGGWVYFQSQTGWSLPTPIASTFDQSVILIIRHRLANPAITARHNLATTKDAVAAELVSFTRARLGMTPVGVPDPPKPGATPRAAACCGG
ncbi:MAG TPA: hypothetical protein VGA09_16675 [Candidatus Binatia bacterium]